MPRRLTLLRWRRMLLAEVTSRAWRLATFAPRVLAATRLGAARVLHAVLVHGAVAAVVGSLLASLDLAWAMRRVVFAVDASAAFTLATLAPAVLASLGLRSACALHAHPVLVAVALARDSTIAVFD